MAVTIRIKQENPLRILLVDVDSTIPNLALMRVSSFYKSQGHTVNLLSLGISYYPAKRKAQIVDTSGYDKVFCSAIFKGTVDQVSFKGDTEIVFGGTGIDLKTTLPPEIEACDLDYSLYPDNDCSYGFISRGCLRKCYFCVVPQKEGKTRQVSQIDAIVKHKKVKFMDNNFLSLPNHMELLKEIVDKKIRCQFNQGLDIRLVTEENSLLLSKLNYMGEYIFAFDDWGYRKYIESKLTLLKWRKPWQLKFYVYVHPDMPLTDTINRVTLLQEWECLPYVMRDLSCWDSDKSDFYTDLAAYANQPNVFKKMTFQDFLMKRHKKIERIDASLKLWLDNGGN